MAGVSCDSLVPARVSVVTVGARDLDTLRSFYRALGWTLAIDLEDFAAFETAGAVLALYPLESLARDAQLTPAAPGGGMQAFNPAINVDSPGEVDETIAAAREAGGHVTKEPVTMEWGGRSAYFTDPEENLWEVAWVPPDTKMAALIGAASAGGRRT